MQSARLNSDSTSLYYQNDIEPIHASEKRYQNFKKENIEVALSNIPKIIQPEENDEICALYVAGNYCLSPEYQKFQVQVMCGTPGVRKGKQITSENLEKTYQIFPMHFACQLMLVKNLATNTGTETQQSQISWWTALRKALQAIASIVQHHVQFHSGIPGQLLKKNLNYIIANICQNRSQNAKEIAADQ